MQRVIAVYATKEEFGEVMITSKDDEVRYMARNMFDGRAFNRATHVFSPYSQEIEDVYAKAGKRVVRKQEEPRPEPKVEKVEDKPKHWSELSWPKMRSLATTYTDEPITSKDQAKEILEKAESEGKI